MIDCDVQSECRGLVNADCNVPIASLFVQQLCSDSIVGLRAEFGDVVFAAEPDRVILEDCLKIQQLKFFEIIGAGVDHSQFLLLRADVVLIVVGEDDLELVEFS